MFLIQGQPTPHLLGDGSRTVPAYAFAAEPGMGMWRNSAAILSFAINGGTRFAIDGSSNARLPSAGFLSWSNNANADAGTLDVRIGRDGADVLAQYRGANPQTFRIYNTLSGADAERGFVRWTANVFEVGTEITGAGVARNLRLISVGAVVNIQIGATDRFRFSSDTLVIGGGTASASFPGMKRVLAALQVRLGDDSAFTDISALNFISQNIAAALSSGVTLNNGAGVAAGTLANAPTAGDPSKWIPINDNGTTRFIPTWT